jgi:ABC-type transport system substrate-binding protein
MSTGYWNKVLGHRIDRRRALAASATLAGSAAFLAACGGSSDGSGSGDSSGLVTQPVDTLKQAKRGGIIKDRTHVEPASLDPVTANAPLNVVLAHTMSSLVQFKPGYLKPSESEVVPDLIESWETSPDGLSITMKMRQGVKWHNKPPINNRALDVEDIVFTWDRFSRKHSARGSVANSADPRAPIVSLTATDNRTIVMKLKEPVVYALNLFASNFSQSIPVLPKETDTTFDIRADVIGTGPWVLSDYQPSVSFTFKRHPDHFDKDAALADQIDMPIIREYAQGVAQLKAGAIYSMGAHTTALQVTPEDVLPVYHEEPRLGIFQGDLKAGDSPVSRVGFGWLPEGRSPFRDERVRQAISMAIERELYIDTFFNVTKFQNEGLPVETRWNSHLSALMEGWWLNPQSQDFGPNGRYFQHDLAEGKKMLSAAGYPSGFETTSFYIPGTELGNAPKQAEVMDGMIRELGITPKVHLIDYLKEYAPSYRDGKGQYDGWAYFSTAGGASTGEAVGAIANEFWSSSSTFLGFSASGKNDLSGDPQIDGLIEKARVEPDKEKRRSIVYDIQRNLAKPMYVLPMPGAATGFVMAWPALGNFRVYRMSRNNYQLWVDTTKPPFKPA